jgi:hypothetical protein
MSDDFKIGDKVEAEFYKGAPRWSWNVDSRPSCFILQDSWWEKGEVLYLNELGSLYLPTMTIKFSGCIWWFPLPGSRMYAIGRPGAPRKINQDTQIVAESTQSLTNTQQLQKKFLGKVNTTGCQCGAWSCNNPHSRWCKCFR